MVVLPLDRNYGSGCSSIIRTELLRVMEYNRLADNKDENQKEIDRIKKRFGITEEDLNNED